MQSDTCWQDVQDRNTAANGRFVYSVRTTGIYCRPSCPSRLARRDNVAFHADCDAAEAAGFRACKRCDPRDARDGAALIASLCRFIDASETMPSLAELGRRAGYSPYHLNRMFKAQTGLTPRAYAAGRRAERLRESLSGGARVTAAFYDAGYNASSRFYADAPAILGMSARAVRQGGVGEAIGYATGVTRLGVVLIGATHRGICSISLGDEPERLIEALHDRFAAAKLTADPALGTLLGQVITLIDTGGTADQLPLDLRGTAFQIRVWYALRGLPSGETISYAALAARIGAPGSARAVARACATNEIAVAVPCHRVVAADGGLSGYRWGVARKKALLKAESAALDLPVPHPVDG